MIMKLFLQRIGGYLMIDACYYKEALYIRRVEDKLLELFSEGKINGTIHTCVGQEFSAIAFIRAINDGDYIVSNHRCHGHYISYSKEYKALIAELMGKKDGVCGGIGGSQHLNKKRFFSNGIQGDMMPIAAGLALASKMKKKDDIAIVFIGDGTLGEGIFYETMNIVSKWQIPLLVVCENNYYAQSTNQRANLAGDIISRAQCFEIKTFESDIWNLEQLFDNAKMSIDFVRNESKPAFHVVGTYRLNPHSKGDDYRDANEIKEYTIKDPLNIFQKKQPSIYKEFLKEIDSEIGEIIKNIESNDDLEIDEYCEVEIEFKSDSIWNELLSNEKKQSEHIYSFFRTEMERNKNIIFLGEDVLYPYGGAFKISKDLSARYPEQVFAAPISEAAITGVSNGLAIAGYRPFLEIMFGDFITLCLDQIINHAVKFNYMYNKQVKCPLVIRTPMGGRRGYGPTHSQTLDKLLLAIDNIKVISINRMIDPGCIYKAVLDFEENPVVIIENKIDYAKIVTVRKINNYKTEVSFVNNYPIIRVRPQKSQPTVTIVTYGGMSDIVLNCIEPLFFKYDLKAEVIILSKIKPVDYHEVIRSVNVTKLLYVVEEGSSSHGIGSEIITAVSEQLNGNIIARRIASLPLPIPSNKKLEDRVLVNEKRIIEVIGRQIV